MQFKCLGHQGPLVSSLGLGCMGMSTAYGPAGEVDSVKTIQAALNLGINFLDTADMYGWGHNETLLSKAIKGQRDRVIIATKTGFVKKDDGFSINGSPSHIKTSCEESLKRLGIETIDLYYLHRVDATIPVEESMMALAALVKEGKIKYIGLSEVKPNTILRAQKIHPVTAVQTEYSLWQRDPELEILPLCQMLGIGFVPYSPLGRGFLAGAVTDIDALSQDDFRRVLPRFQSDNFAENKTIIQRLAMIAKQKHCTIAQLSLAWLMAQGENIVPIPGTRKLAHLLENIAAVDINLSKEEVERISQLVPLGYAKGEKYPAHLNFEN